MQKSTIFEASHHHIQPPQEGGMGHKAYIAPDLVAHGTLEEITQGTDAVNPTDNQFGFIS